MARPFLQRFYIYLIERFALFTIIPATILHYLLILRFFNDRVTLSDIWDAQTIVGYLTFFSVFLVIRLVDELKDKRHDDKYYLQRPIQRGLITLTEVRVTISIVAIIISFLQILFMPLYAQVAYVLLVLFLLCMRYEFFIEHILSKNILLYAVIHQLFIPILIQYLSYGLGDNTAVAQLGWFVLLNWLMIFAVEVARKIRASSEDETGFDTYSSVYGHTRAVVLLIVIMGITAYSFTEVFSLTWLAWISLVPLLAASLYYLLTDSTTSSKLILASTTFCLTFAMIWALI